MRIVTERQIKGHPLSRRTVAVIGFGSQGEAHALNLRDSGVRVVVGLRSKSRSRARAPAAGLDVASVGDAAARGDVLALLVPDETAREVFDKEIAGCLPRAAAVLFAHGFAVRFSGLSVPEGRDVIMVAPMGPGQRLRERFVEGGGLPASFAIERDATGRARSIALGYAKAIGCARVGLFETTFAEETEIDLFAEQAVLCGGVTRLVTSAFDTLVEAGYDPALAYMECLYELDLTANLIRRYGIAGMRGRISRTALFGDLTRGGHVIGPESRDGMKNILEQVRSGLFAGEWLEDGREGHPELRERLAEESDRMIERVGKKLKRIAHPPDGGVESS
jgi:ketol-acid reductoisomerase